MKLQPIPRKTLPSLIFAVSSGLVDPCGHIIYMASMMLAIDLHLLPQIKHA
jgi:hypothetical protein